MQRALGAAIINFCIVTIHCKNVTVTLGETKSVDVSDGKTLSIKCKLNSGSFDATESRSWVANGVPLIDDGISSTAGSGYAESLQADGFTLVTPTLTHTFDGTRYQCSYGFSQAYLDVRIYGIGRTDQSKGDCIDGKSVNNCWFSLSTVIPEVSSENLTISYEDGTMEDIKSLLNITSQLNADGKTRDYFYKITPASFSMDVKTIELSFFANPILRTLTIEAIKGLTTPYSTIMSTTVSEPISSDMPTTVSEVPPSPPISNSSSGLPQEIVIIIIISSVLGAGGLIFLIVKLCRQKTSKTPAKIKENCFATKQGNFTKKDALKSSVEARKSKFSGKRNAKQESISFNKFEHTQFDNSGAPKDRMYEHYPQAADYMYWNSSGNQHDFNQSHAERNMFKYENQHDRYPKSHSGPNNRIGYQSHYPEHPGHNEGMFQYYRADKLYRGQQMYQGPNVAQYDRHIKNKPENKRRFEGRSYERNWDFLY